MKNSFPGGFFMYKVKTDFGDYDVNIVTHTYENNNTLCIELISPIEGPFARLTVNIADSDLFANENRAFVDLNNCPWVEDFIEENKLGEFVGIWGSSGFCTYPLYEFDLGKLK